MASLKVGDKAPDFALESSEGKMVSLGDLKGSTLVLYFYPKDDTPGCTKEACSFSDNLARVKRKGAVIYGVSSDSIESHKKFVKKYGISFPLLSDETKKILKAYGVWKQKSFMGRKYMGIERTTYVIDTNGKISRIFHKVKVEGHADEVIQVL